MKHPPDTKAEDVGVTSKLALYEVYFTKIATPIY